NRALAAAEGRLALLVGVSDLTDLCVVGGNGLRYAALPLPVGETQVKVYLISPAGEWRELAQFPLRVVVPAEPVQVSLEPKPSETLPGNTGAPAQPGAQPAAQPATPAPAARKYGFDKFASTPSLNLGLKS